MEARGGKESKERRRGRRGRRRRRRRRRQEGSPKIHCGAGNHRVNTDRMKERSGKGREREARGGWVEEEEQREEWSTVKLYPSHMYLSHMSLGGWVRGW